MCTFEMFRLTQLLLLSLPSCYWQKQFCFMGKQLDKRVAELGGTRIMPLTCVDEVMGMDEVIERWIEELEKLV